MSELTTETLLIRRLTAALQDLIEGSPDPGSEALGAVWEGKHYKDRPLFPVLCCTVCGGRGDGLTGGHYKPDDDFIEAPYMEPCEACAGTGSGDAQRELARLRAECADAGRDYNKVLAAQLRERDQLLQANAKLYEALEELAEAPVRSPEHVERAEAVLRDVKAELASWSSHG